MHAIYFCFLSFPFQTTGKLSTNRKIPNGDIHIGRRVDLDIFCVSRPIKVSVRVWLHNEKLKMNIGSTIGAYLKTNNCAISPNEMAMIQNLKAGAYYVTRVEVTTASADDDEAALSEDGIDKGGNVKDCSSNGHLQCSSATVIDTVSSSSNSLDESQMSSRNKSAVEDRGSNIYTNMDQDLSDILDEIENLTEISDDDDTFPNGENGESWMELSDLSNPEHLKGPVPEISLK